MGKKYSTITKFIKCSSLLFFLLITITNYAQVANIDFTNSWVSTSNVAIANSEMTITGVSNGIRKSYFDVNVSSALTEIYFVAEIQLDNIVLGDVSYKAPKLKVYKGGTTTTLEVLNLTYAPEGDFFTAAIKLSNFNSLGLSQIRVEFAMQNTQGTMVIKNTQLLSTAPAHDYTFPFAIPADPSCNLSINTANFHDFENSLLSANTHFTWASYSWSTPEVTNIINTNFPMKNMRFPGGTMGNFYDWSTDGFYNNSYTQGNSAANNGLNNNFNFDYNGYKTLCLNNNASSTLMFNVITDDVNTAKNRLQSRINDGLTIDWVEMGNENFFSNQGLGNVNTTANYISHTNSLATELKQIDANIKVAVNISHDDYRTGYWNDLLSNENYYDAVVTHPYINTNTFLISKFSTHKMLSAYKITKKTINEFSTHFPNIPLLFTEWNILSGNASPLNFIQTLGIMDMFLAIERGNQDGIVQQAGIHMFYHSDNYYESTLTYYDNSTNKMVLTANGIAYAALFKVFQNNKVYDAYSTSSDLDTDLPAVNAKAVDAGDDIKIFVVNKLPVSSPLNLTIDGTAYSGNYTLETYTETINQPLTTPYADYNSAWTTSNASGAISIPAYSIAIVTIQKSNVVLPVEFTYFDAAVFNEQSVLLEWETASEINNDYFTVEKSQDGKEWIEVDKLKSKGSTSFVQNYSMIDFYPFLGTSYYRLKQTDYDGTITYSNPKAILFKNNPNSIKAYPNPAQNEINVKGENFNTKNIKIYNVLGLCVNSSIKIIPIDTNEIKIDVSLLPKGYYILKTRTAAIQIEVIR